MQSTLERLQSRLADRYLVERELGSGGMATVFLARDIRHDREVAIKVLHPELSASIGHERFEREIKLAAKLQHPHILGLYDSGEADGLLYYVMPFVKGESLRDRLLREGQLPIEDAIQIVLEVADALGHAHSQGIIHRDIKPENILISGGHALVADFGIARAASEAGGQKLTQTGMAVGTPIYMAPEQSAGDHVGPTSDLYSLGCMLYELLAGEPPFTAKNAQALMARHAMEAVPSIRIIRNTVPEEVEDAIFATMAKVPADRPQSAAQFAEMLGVQLGATASRRAAIRHTASRRIPTASHRVTEFEAPAWWRRPWVIGAAVLVLGGGAFAGWKVATAGRPGARTGTELAHAKQVAVLYFERPPGDEELGAVADGLTDALIRSLQKVRVLTVRPPSAVARFRGKDIPADSVARALDAGTLVQGSIRPEGQNRIRVTIWLTDAFGSELGGGRTSLVVQKDALLTAEDEVAATATEKLRSELGVNFQVAESQARAANPAAWRLYNRAEASRKDAEQAVRQDPARAAGLLAQSDSLLQQAVAADSKWIDPVLLRGDVARQRSALAAEKVEKGSWLDSALANAQRGLALDPGSARAQAQRGTIRYAQWRLALGSDAAARAALLDDAQKDLEEAVQKDGTLAAAYATLSFLYYDKKDRFTALTRARQAWDADEFLSNSDVILSRLFFGYYDTEQFAEARTWCETGRRRFPMDHRFTLCQLWLLLAPEVKPDIPEAWRFAAKMDTLAPGGTSGLESHKAHLIVGGVIGRAAKQADGGIRAQLMDSAHKVLERARLDNKVDPTRELVGYEAIMRTQMGEFDLAIDLLKQYVALNPDHPFKVGGNVHWWWRDLRNRPGFEALLARQR